MLYFCKVRRLQILSRLNSPMASKTRSRVHISSLLNDLCCQNTEIYLKIRLIFEMFSFFFKLNNDYYQMVIGPVVPGLLIEGFKNRI